MRKSVATVLTATILGLTLLTPPAQADAEDCVAHAVSEADAGFLLADLACAAATVLDCYRVFRVEYGPQLWALAACELR